MSLSLGTNSSGQSILLPVPTPSSSKAQIPAPPSSSPSTSISSADYHKTLLTVVDLNAIDTFLSLHTDSSSSPLDCRPLPGGFETQVLKLLDHAKSTFNLLQAQDLKIADLTSQLLALPSKQKIATEKAAVEYEHLDRQAKVLARKLAIAKNLIDSGGSPTASHHAETAGLKADVRFLKHRLQTTESQYTLLAHSLRKLRSHFLTGTPLVATDVELDLHPRTSKLPIMGDAEAEHLLLAGKKMSHIRRINRVGLDEAIVLQAHEIVNASSDILPLLSLPPLDLLGLPNLPLPPLPLPSPSPVLSNAPLPDLPLPTSSSNSKKRRQTSPSTSGAGAPPQPSPPAPELQPPSTRPRRSSQANTNINKVPEVLPPTPDQSHRPTSSQPSPFAGMNDLLKAAEVLLEDVGPIAPTIFPRPPMAEEEEELPRIIPRERLPKRRRVEHSDWAPPPSKQSLPPSKQNQHPRRVPQSTWVPPLINPNQSTAIASSSSVIHHTPDVYSALEVLADQAASAFSSHLTSKIYTSHNSSLSGLSILSPPTVSRLSKNLPSVNDGANGSGTGAGNTVGVNRSTLNTSKLQFGDPGQLYVVKDETAGEKQKRERSPYIKWNLAEDEKLVLGVLAHGQRWDQVASCVPTRSYHQCRQRWLRGLRSGNALPGELVHYQTDVKKAVKDYEASRGRNKDRLAHLRGSGCDAGENEEDEEEDTDVDAEVDADGEAEQES